MSEILDLYAFMAHAAYALAPQFPPTAFVFDGSQMTQQMVSLDYDTAPSSNSHVVSTSAFDNNNEDQVITTISASKFTTASAHWSVVRGYTWGANVKFDIPSPIASTGDKIHKDVSFSITSQQSLITIQEWDVSEDVAIPPHCRVEASVVLETGQISTGFTAKVVIAGRPEWRVPHHDSPVAPRLGDIFANQLIEGVRIIDPDSIELIVTGRFDGDQGVRMYVVSKRYSLD